MNEMKQLVVTKPERRLGRFWCTREFLDDWKNARIVMQHMVIVHAEMHYEDLTVRYLAFSELFDVVPSGCCAPKYKIVTEKKEVLPGEYEFTVRATKEDA